MRRIILILLLATVQNVFAIEVSYYVDECWGPWRRTNCRIYGNYTGFKLYDKSQHPANWHFRFEITDIYSLEEMKRANYVKNKEGDKWAEFKGYVEYYITDDYPSIRSQMLSGLYVVPWQHNVELGQTPCKLIRSKARINVLKFSKHPEIYNIYFDEVGIAISLDGSYF